MQRAATAAPERNLPAGGWVHLSFPKTVKIATEEQLEVPQLQPGSIFQVAVGEVHGKVQITNKSETRDQFW